MKRSVVVLALLVVSLASALDAQGPPPGPGPQGRPEPERPEAHQLHVSCGCAEPLTCTPSWESFATATASISAAQS